MTFGDRQVLKNTLVYDIIVYIINILKDDEIMYLTTVNRLRLNQNEFNK
ncbi:hypothetical protein [Gottschalkia purinilytica]|nr:hypothetical protein [Gottschalkia purinilytica]